MSRIKNQDDLPQGNPNVFGAIFRTASPGERDAAKWRALGSPSRYSQLVRPDALNVFGFGTFIAGNDVKRHLISLVQGLKTLADDGSMVNEDVLA